jgi:hypothetical protein
MTPHVITEDFTNLSPKSPASAAHDLQAQDVTEHSPRGAAPKNEILTGFESTYALRHDRDVCESNRHIERRCEDVDLLAATGVRRVRYPVRWHRVEEVPGRLD